MRHIPNILTCIRILLVGIFVYMFMNAQYVASIIIYAISFLTDLLDGYLARRNNWTTPVGKVLDPLADKLMLVAVLVCFFINDSIPRWILIVIAAEEFIMILVGAILYFMKIVVYSDWFGKIATGLFAMAIVFTFVHIIGEHNYGVNIFGWAEYVFIAAVAASLIAFIHYGINIIKGHYSDSTPAKN